MFPATGSHRLLEDERTIGAACESGKRVPNVIPSHLHGVEAVGGGVTPELLEERLHLRGKVQVDALLVGAGAAHRVVARLLFRSRERRPDGSARPVERANCSTQVAPLLK